MALDLIEGLFGSLVPPEVCFALWRGQVRSLDDEEPPLFAEEEEAIRRAVPERRREFARGRHCARRALEALGLEPGSIPVGTRREPVWPEGAVGSISHTEHLVAAVTARSDAVAALGLDLEPARPLPPEVIELVMTAPERSREPLDAAVVFSAKEAVYKAIYPLTGVFLEFRDVVVRLRDDGTFGVEPATPTCPPVTSRLLGRHAIADGTIVTLVVLDPRDTPADRRAPRS